jgi:glycosyltransferase involved in cell wall biosynthesis
MYGQPTISIIIPLYNQAASIGRTISSVLSQQMTDWEMIVVDNGSTDAGGAIAQGYNDTRIRHFSLPERSGGPGKPRNYGLDHARGEWVLFLDGDDAIESDHLTTLLQTAKEQSGATVIAGHWQEYSADAPTQRTLMPPAGYPNGLSELPTLTIAAAPWAIHAAIIQRHILVPPYRWVEELDPYPSEDTAFWFRILSKHACAYSPYQGALYQRSPDSRNQAMNTARWLAGIQAVTASNVMFLQQMHLPLTAKHCEYLMRLYSSIYCLARQRRDHQTAALALTLAQDWFSKCFALGGCTSLSLKARKVLGIKKFLWFSTLTKLLLIFRKVTLVL